MFRIFFQSGDGVAGARKHANYLLRPGGFRARFASPFIVYLPQSTEVKFYGQFGPISTRFCHKNTGTVQKCDPKKPVSGWDRSPVTSRNDIAKRPEGHKRTFLATMAWCLCQGQMAKPIHAPGGVSRPAFPRQARLQSMLAESVMCRTLTRSRAKPAP